MICHVDGPMINLKRMILKFEHVQFHTVYSATCLERPLPWETTCLYRPHFCGQWGGLSRQVLLYCKVITSVVTTCNIYCILPCTSSGYPPETSPSKVQFETTDDLSVTGSPQPGTAVKIDYSSADDTNDTLRVALGGSGALSETDLDISTSREVKVSPWDMSVCDDLVVRNW